MLKICPIWSPCSSPRLVPSPSPSYSPRANVVHANHFAHMSLHANVALHKCRFPQMLLCTNVALHKCCFAQMLLCANVASCKCCFAQMSLRANVASRKCRFAQMLLSHNYGPKSFIVQSPRTFRDLIPNPLQLSKGWFPPKLKSLN
jgi:hypothetical protein